MANPPRFSPHELFSGTREPARVLVSPPRYIQGKDAIDSLGRYLSVISSRRPVTMMTQGGWLRFGERIRKSLQSAGIESQIAIFQGECSYEEVERICDEIRKNGFADSVIAVGGGKCLDAGKCVAFRLSVPAVICKWGDAPYRALHAKEG